MHEVSIALNLLDIIEKKCREEGYQKVESVKVRVGKASSVQPEAFSFAFEIVKKDTRAQNARFIIDPIPLGGTCLACGNRFETEEAYILECPSCGSLRLQVTQGYELEIVELEVE
ncbi:MAG: hydrogenase maturation nickel metallochaperone HypA [Syntrophaceae bacterium]|nr:hydrogenase maturation nickel metallochaperone HypA [Syntrophaceae bacterium]